jgi:hypothetical protein
MPDCACVKQIRMFDEKINDLWNSDLMKQYRIEQINGGTFCKNCRKENNKYENILYIR